MKHYSRAERHIARSLDRLPRFRRVAKVCYQRFSYILWRRSGFRYTIHRMARVQSPAEWAGVRRQPSNGVQEFAGYYDTSPWSPGMRFLLSHQQAGADTCDLMLYDRTSSSCRALASTHAWNLQQGSRAHWWPCVATPRVLFNDVVDGRLVARIVDIANSSERICPFPIQSIAPQADTAISLNYLRLGKLRPEYGYAVDVANFDADQDHNHDGLWLVDLRSGDARMLINIGELVEHDPRTEMQSAQHKVNHAVFSPNGSRVVFLHRWIGPHGKFSRLFVANADGAALRLLLDNRMVSHYSWRDDRSLLVWARAGHGDRYYLLDVTDGSLQTIGQDVLDRYGDGHPSYSPDRRWIVTDTYPDRARQQRLLLFDTLHDRLIEVGRFFAPWTFEGPKRSDLHPRWSPDGRLISIDSAHDGTRRSYCIDVSSILDENI